MRFKGILREFQGIERNWKPHVMAYFFSEFRGILKYLYK